MKPKTVIITGANSGIGKAAAIRFASENPIVIMACRDLIKGETARAEVIQRSNNSTVELMELDVSSFNSINRFCSEFNKKYDKLDVLINNAAFFEHGKKSVQYSVDNIELTFATNTFGPYLLTQLLKDSLSKSSDPRVLNACTENVMHFFDPKRKIDFEFLTGPKNSDKPYSVYKFYGDSKMALLMLTFRLAEEYRKDNIKVNSIIIPGVKLSKEALKKFSPLYRVLAMIKQPFSLPPERLGDCYYHICNSDEFINVTGQAINKDNLVMQAAKHDKGFAKTKELLSFSFIPKYAYDKNESDRLLENCRALTANWSN